MLTRLRLTSTKKNFLREYHVPSQYNLYDLHRFIQSDMNFDDSQMAVFHVVNVDGKVTAQYALFDLGDGAMDSIQIENLVLKKGSQLIYIFDLFHRRSFFVQILNEAERLPRKSYPMVAISEEDAPDQFEEKLTVEKFVVRINNKLPEDNLEKDHTEEDESDDEEPDNDMDQDDEDAIDENDLEAFETRGEL